MVLTQFYAITRLARNAPRPYRPASCTLPAVASLARAVPSVPDTPEGSVRAAFGHVRPIYIPVHLDGLVMDSVVDFHLHLQTSPGHFVLFRGPDLEFTTAHHARLLANNVHLEVCPSCNIQIDVFDRYEDHPIDRLRRLGISVGLNTDARGPTNLTLTDEYERMHQIFGWGLDEFRASNRSALSAAFIPPETRLRLLHRL